MGKVIDPMDEVRKCKEQLSKELEEAKRKGKLNEKLKEIETRNKRMAKRLKIARQAR